ncbi:sporulation sigma-E factor-processing peptidase [Paraliobacillus quinghaiensis]|uniref:Sporulation sigma-E factor-processing peptidase n=1 Tax=Paraliobacillus quinghaiensis TaxID=470815 RepID=A0A917TH88_9BACI|nr:sigma-E processing peptidase SpoIIGA [Paraliobacillus quinghaiensis]GGM20695.1 sporulation sigma-E factor-processing peptidase [Paraliobacillus quinghaiensis]
MTIYLDAVMLLNFLLDWMILLLTQQMTKIPTRRLSLLFAALVAAMLVPLTVFYPDSFLLHPLGKVIYSIIIIFVGFGFGNFRRFSRLFITFYFVSIILGGGLTAIHFFINSPVYLSEHGILTWEGGYGDPISWLFVVIGFPFVWVFTKRTMDKHAITKFRQDQHMNVIIALNDRVITTIGYVDSGNQLVDPISKKPVIICDHKIMREIYTIEQLEQIKKAQDTCDFNEISNELMTQVQFVPYQGVSGDHSFLIVVKPQYLTISYLNQTIKTSKVLIGIQFGNLSPDESYHCLLQPALLNHVVTNSA